MKLEEVTSGLAELTQAQRLRLRGQHLHQTAIRSTLMEHFQMQTTNLGLVLLYGTVMGRVLLHWYSSWTRLTSQWKSRHWQHVGLWNLVAS